MWLQGQNTPKCLNFRNFLQGGNPHFRYAWATAPFKRQPATPCESLSMYKH